MEEKSRGKEGEVYIGLHNSGEAIYGSGNTESISGTGLGITKGREKERRGEMRFRQIDWSPIK